VLPPFPTRRSSDLSVSLFLEADRQVPGRAWSMSVLPRSPHGGNQIWVSLALKRVLEAPKLGYLIVERPAHPPGSARRGRLPHVTERCPQVRPGQPAQSA